MSGAHRILVVGAGGLSSPRRRFILEPFAVAGEVDEFGRDLFPLPRFWYFPDDHKAVIIATGDDLPSGLSAQVVSAGQPGSKPRE